MCLFLILVPLLYTHMHTRTSLHPVSSLLWLPKSLFPHAAQRGGASSTQQEATPEGALVPEKKRPHFTTTACYVLHDSTAES